MAEAGAGGDEGRVGWAEARRLAAATSERMQESRRQLAIREGETSERLDAAWEREAATWGQETQEWAEGAFEAGREAWDRAVDEPVDTDPCGEVAG